MPELFFLLMKEEWRMHSAIFGDLAFALFPLMIFAFTFMGSFLLPWIGPSVPGGDLAMVVHGIFLVLGCMVGGFGLMGNEMMNRRFGQGSLLVHNVRTLPLSDRSIFLHFVVKDIVYYFFLWVLPFGLGFLAASPFTGTMPAAACRLLLTTSVAFMTGLCLIFLLSSLYVRSGRVFSLALLMLGAGAAFVAIARNMNLALLFPPVLLYRSFSCPNLLATCIVLICLFFLSIALFEPDTQAVSRRFPDALAPLIGRVSFLPNPALVSKDFLDLRRSGIGIGQTLFSFLIPLMAIWFFLSLLAPVLPSHGLLIVFAIIAGVIASTIYTWVTEFDSFGFYTFLPVDVGTLIGSKFTSFSILQAIPAIFIFVFALVKGTIALAISAVVLCLSVSFFAAALMTWLTGLWPSVLVYDVRVLIVFLLANGVILAIFSTLAFMNPLLALSSAILLVPARNLVRGAARKWNAVDPKGI